MTCDRLDVVVARSGIGCSASILDILENCASGSLFVFGSAVFHTGFPGLLGNLAQLGNGEWFGLFIVVSIWVGDGCTHPPLFGVGPMRVV